MTGLRSALKRYLNMRQGLGYKYQDQARQLSEFVSFMEARKATTITTKLALAWATLPPRSDISSAMRLTVVRGFARHVASIDPKTEVPPNGIFPQRRRPRPYIYSEGEIDALLTAALALPPMDGLRRWTYQRGDVDLKDGVLTVRKGKFGKSRLIPLHPTTCEALRSYAKRRDHHLGSRCCAHFFVAERGGRLVKQYVHAVFWRLSREIGLRRPGDSSGPRVHDLRHSFAVRSLLGWYRDGADVEKRLPILSTYLGHTCVRDTYWYLSACPDLMQEAVRRLDRRWEVKP